MDTQGYHFHKLLKTDTTGEFYFIKNMILLAKI